MPTYRIYSDLQINDRVDFTYNGKRRFGRVENKVAGPSGAVLTVEGPSGCFKSYTASKIVGLVVTNSPLSGVCPVPPMPCIR